MSTASRLLGTILRHDHKSTSYKLALIRAINDVVLAYPGMSESEQRIALPVRLLAERWVAYYWPFTHPTNPIKQGNASGIRQDMSFRRGLQELQQEWMEIVQSSRPADGFFLVSELQTSHRRQGYPKSLLEKYTSAVSAISSAVEMPIRYAGPGQWTVFSRPAQAQSLSDVAFVPGTQDRDRCIVIEADLWGALRDLSLWVEALCIHEWCLYTESVDGTNRGEIYTLLTQRPDNRRPLTWERNQIEILLMEGHRFTCPWTGKALATQTYDVDHIIPISVIPINEMWNLVPSDRRFNQHKKRDRIPSSDRLLNAIPRFAATYGAYLQSSDLSVVLTEDVGSRFGLGGRHQFSEGELAKEVGHYVTVVSHSLNLATF